jgi:ribosomal protein L40E
MLLVGFMAVAATYPTVQDLQSTMGQVGRFVDPQIQQRYESAVSTMQLGGLLIVVGFIVLVIGSVAGGAQPTAVLREAPIGRQTPKMYVAGAELARDDLSVMTTCPNCSRPIPRGASKCESCGHLMGHEDLANRPSLKELIDSGKIRVETGPPVAVAGQPPSTIVEPTTVEKVFCYYCGAPIPSDAVYCRGCGRKQRHPTT